MCEREGQSVCVCVCVCVCVRERERERKLTSLEAGDRDADPQSLVWLSKIETLFHRRSNEMIWEENVCRHTHTHTHTQ